ncbi:Phosphoglycolate phosphatase [Roseovarius sp. THAF9]|uniref:phosphoglycolate phosphatase n=1 Tax=Roseovarius sp. THAF9 TaxID=2587847 RepID=UPI00126786C2|nr:phosphoglycolate phosphatase [Roseovarius sp. THAF9]QFT94215.1 Phosphoglycolate phosphatase [Roseovarius sp. THAF9]
MKQAVVFDLDGTLIDSAPDIHAAANTVLERRDIAPFTLAEARDFVGHGAAVFVERCLSARGLAADTGLQTEVLDDFLALYEGAVHLTRPYPGVVACLDALAAEGLKLAVCTNKPEGPTAAVLTHLGLDRYFGVVVGGDTLTVRKPDPAPLHEVTARLGAASVLFVGDSEVDAETAARAEVPFALYTQGYRRTSAEELPHDARFDAFDDLPAIVRRLLGVG